MSLRICIVLCLVLLVMMSSHTNAQSDISISTCQSITQSGHYSLTDALTGAPIQITTEADLFPAYIDSSLENTCIEILADDVTLDCHDNMLTGPSGEAKGSVGIYIAGSFDNPLSNVSVTNCQISAYHVGIYAGHLNGGQFSHNGMRRNTGTGFYLTGLTDISVTNNTAEGNNPDGILIIGSHNITVADNVAFYNRMRGITFEGCGDCTVARNESYSHGVLGFAIYGSQNMKIEDNTAYDNHFHGFAILHEAGSATFTGNTSYENEGSGFFVQASHNNHFSNNESHDNALDGITLLDESQNTTIENNTLHANQGYGLFSSTPNTSITVAGNDFAENGRGAMNDNEDTEFDYCRYTGFGPEGPCDPIFEGGANNKDLNESAMPPTNDTNANEVVIQNAYIDGDPIYYPAFGDLWMTTWADDDRLFVTWGDGTGFSDGYPMGYPAYENESTVTANYCEERDIYTLENEGYFPCWLWCNIFACGPDQTYSSAPLTDTGIMAFEGQVPDFTGASNVAIDVPTGEPFMLADSAEGITDVAGRNDKPASLLFVDGRLYFAGYSPAGNPILGYIAYSDDYGQTWTEMMDSPWSETSNFKILMFINMGQAYALNQDGYVYALGVGGDVQWNIGTVYLTRAPRNAMDEYSAYTYFGGMDGDMPRWSLDQNEAVPLDGLSTIGQGSAMYHAGTERYLFLTTTTDYNPIPDQLFGYGGLFEAPQPWGPWTQVADLCFQPECDDGSVNPLWTDRGAPNGTEPGKYIPSLIPKDAGSNHIYFTVAGGNIHYQLQMGKLILETNP